MWLVPDAARSRAGEPLQHPGTSSTCNASPLANLVQQPLFTKPNSLTSASVYHEAKPHTLPDTATILPQVEVKKEPRGQTGPGAELCVSCGSDESCEKGGMSPIRDAGLFPASHSGLSPTGASGSIPEASPWGSPASSLSPPSDPEPGTSLSNSHMPWDGDPLGRSDPEAWPALPAAGELDCPPIPQPQQQQEQQPEPFEQRCCSPETKSVMTTVLRRGGDGAAAEGSRCAGELRVDNGSAGSGWEGTDTAWRLGGCGDGRETPSQRDCHSRGNCSQSGDREQAVQGVNADGFSVQPGGEYGRESPLGDECSSWPVSVDCSSTDGWGIDGSNSLSRWREQERCQPDTRSTALGHNTENEEPVSSTATSLPNFSSKQEDEGSHWIDGWQNETGSNTGDGHGVSISQQSPTSSEHGDEVGKSTELSPGITTPSLKDYDQRVLSNTGWGQTPVRQNTVWDTTFKRAASPHDTSRNEETSTSESGCSSSVKWDNMGRSEPPSNRPSTAAAFVQSRPVWEPETAHNHSNSGRGFGPKAVKSGGWPRAVGEWDPAGQGWEEHLGSFGCWGGTDHGSWEEPSPETQRRKQGLDDGTSAWGDPESHNYKPVNLWSRDGSLSDGPSRSNVVQNKSTGWTDGTESRQESGGPDRCSGWAKGGDPSGGWSENRVGDGQRRQPWESSGPRIHRENWQSEITRDGPVSRPQQWDEGDGAEIGFWNSESAGTDGNFCVGTQSWGMQGRRNTQRGGQSRGMNRHEEARMQRLIRQLMDMGFSRDPAEEALKSNNLSLDQALSALLDRKVDGSKRTVDPGRGFAAHYHFNFPKEQSSCYDRGGPSQFFAGGSLPSPRGLGPGVNPGQSHLRNQVPPQFVPPQVTPQLIQAMKNGGLNPALLALSQAHVTPQHLALINQLSQLQLAHQQLVVQQQFLQHNPRLASAVGRQKEQQMSRTISSMQLQIQHCQRQLAMMLAPRGSLPHPATTPVNPLDILPPTSPLDVVARDASAYGLLTSHGRPTPPMSQPFPLSGGVIGSGSACGGGNSFKRTPGSPGRRKSWKGSAVPGDRRGAGFGGMIATVDNIQPQSRLRRWTLPHSLDSMDCPTSSNVHASLRASASSDSPLEDSPFDSYDAACHEAISDPADCWSIHKVHPDKVSNGSGSASWPPEFHPGEPWRGLQVSDAEQETTGMAGVSVSANRNDRCLFTVSVSDAASSGLGAGWSLDRASSDAFPSKYSSTYSSEFQRSAKMNDIKSSWTTIGQPVLSSRDPWKVPRTSAAPSRPPPGLAGQKSASSWPGVNPLWANPDSKPFKPGSPWSNDGGGGRATAWLVLRNLTPQIDGSTLRTLCMQHGPLITFHLNLAQGSALVHYSSREEVAKAQKSLHMCVLGNTTIVAEFAGDEEVSRFLAQGTLSVGPTASPWPIGQGPRATMQGPGVPAVYGRSNGLALSAWNGRSSLGTTSPSLWGPTSQFLGDSLWGSSSAKSSLEESGMVATLLPGDLLGGSDGL
uniref:trinucleotide repeat-containing gene 6C protein-like isoform X3 n=1 Tax=Myxine glutinosa TaxID=7769 RepID=UPI00358FF5CA